MAVNVDNMSDDEFEKMMQEAINDEDSVAEEDLVEPEMEETEYEPEDESSEEAIVDEADNSGSDVAEVDESEQDESDEADDEAELEQPTDDGTEESNDDETEEDEEEVEGDEDSETDGDAKPEDEEQPANTDTKDKSEPEQVLNRFKANGSEFEFTQAETIELAKMGIDYRKKTQAIAPWRKQISALEAEGIDQEQLNLMIDALKGDKKALASVMKRTGVEAFDLDTEADDEYVPNDYGKSTVELDIEEITSSISQDKEYPITHNVISSQWDEKSRDEIIANPGIIKLLHQDVQDGTYDKVAPMAMKLKIFGDGSKSDIELYKEAGAQYYAQLQAKKSVEPQETKREVSEADKIESVKAETAKRKANKKLATKRKAAAPTKSKAGTKDVIDYLNMDTMSDDEFSEFMDKEIKRK